MCVYVCVCVCVYVCMYTYMCVHVFVYVCIYVCVIDIYIKCTWHTHFLYTHFLYTHCATQFAHKVCVYVILYIKINIYIYNT